MNLYEESKKNEKIAGELRKRSLEARERGDIKEAQFLMHSCNRVERGVMMDHEPTYHGMCPRCQKPMGNHVACYCKHCGQLVDKEPLEKYLD